ncbi:penicillin-binding protein 2 [Geminicoccaceae bacterium 1502E]|nr:penicillin-binding protein 2 [Geminicoccaceae bacterium 1502E]
MRLEGDRARSFTRRALLVGGVQTGLFGLLAARLWNLQVEENATWRLLADDNRISERLIVPPRGRILDRLGRPLATNMPTYRVRVVREQARDLRGVLERLAMIVPLSAGRIDEIERQARSLRAFVPVVVREDLSWEQVASIAVRSPDLPGVMLDAGLLRQYPYGSTVSHILGYVGAVSREELQQDPDPLLQLPEFRIGKNGVERSHDAALRGRAGLLRVEVNAVGREIRELERHEGDAGADLKLSLDLDLQRFCFERLAEQLSASAVVMDVHSGAVLAMVSVPSYDPRAFARGISTELWQALVADPFHPLVNKCIRGEYPPGSTFKMVTALAALEAGVATPRTEVFCPGYMVLGNARFHCWKQHGHGRLQLEQALAQSCDIFFYEMARRVGVDGLAAVSRRLGLGGPTGIDLPGEKGGLAPTSQWKRERFGVPWQKGETLITGIGQGFMLATPLQLAVMTARLANGGRAVEPWLARSAQGQPGAAADLGFAAEHLAPILAGMNEVVNGSRGTARAAALQGLGVAMAGKTGTSQVRRITKAERASGAHKRKDRPREHRDHALFVCFAPVEAPRYAVSVIVDHGDSGSATAAPIARDIMKRTLELAPGGGPLQISGLEGQRQ